MDAMYANRILFADDQPDVAKTLTTLFKNPTTKVDYATDGHQALERCRTQRYDLLIVDLQMPPGEWGGLWLLQTLQEAGFSVPAMVLSGQAGQLETIEALHLGAKGFVLKDRAQTDLAQRVETLLADVRREARALSAQLLPTPLAIHCARIDSADTTVQRLYLTLYTLEYALRTTCLTAAAEARAAKTSSARAFLDRYLPAMMSPSMGTTNQICRAIPSALPTSHAAHLANQFDSRLTNDAIAIRNEIAHVQMPSALKADEHLHAVDAALDSFLCGVTRAPQPEIIVPNSLTFDGKHYKVAASILRGSGTALPQRTLFSERPLVSQHPYLWHEDPIDLWPFFTAEPGREVGRIDVALLDGVAGGGKQMSPSDPLRFIRIQDGERVQSTTATAVDLEINLS
ncbi:response regulator [Allorhizocola rhizosphaerae]|uniref:response regulator n=1 Tax=Allorhizocola rhizosphaerae TaxID=1872709 RepID=UPI000E3D4189|nr:response regulator [Allorhizocola rhizosphaerae]